MFRKVEENTSMLSRVVENTLKTQSKLVGVEECLRLKIHSMILIAD